MGTDSNKPLISGILVIAEAQNQLRLLQRITSHLPSHKNAYATSITEAEVEMMRHEPDAVIIDVTNLKSGAMRSKIEPFVLSLPGWIKTFFVDAKPNPTRLKIARDLGISGILTTPFSHHGISQLILQLTGAEAEEARSTEPDREKS